jgi:lipopolysaccharide export system permease protein
MLRIVDRYLLREFLLYLLLGLCTFVGIYIVVDLFEKIDVFIDYQAAAGIILVYFANKLPLIIIQVLPVAMLLGAILSLGHLRKFNEITAMQSCGLSPLRITAPLLASAAVITAAAFLVSEQIVPSAYLRQKEIMDVGIKKRRPESARTRADIRYMGRGYRVYNIHEFRPEPPRMTGVSVQQFDPDSLRMRKRIDARGARWQGGIWVMEDGFARLFADSVEIAVPFAIYADSRWTEQPDEFARPEPDPFFMNRHQLSDYIRRIRESGARVDQYETDYHLRAAFPLANFIMVLLGSCLSLRIVRGTLALGFGLSISLGFIYYGFIVIGQALGYNGDLAPPLAAWMGNFVFIVVGSLLFWRMNR